MHAKPFLKWAGGKNQLIAQIEKQIPKQIIDRPFTYIEPFIGSGAVLFWLLNHVSNLKQAVINDVNTDLINCYKTVQHNVEELIAVLVEWEKEYHSILNNEEQKKEYFYTKRDLFNQRKAEQTIQSALLIFLNKTCFNGLYRVNRKNEFNVPIGSYKKPQICNENNLRLVSRALTNVTILNGDYSQTLEYATANTLFYFDPPYKPLTVTSSFNAYAKNEFNDDEQIRLAKFCEKLNMLNHSWVLSNSDVRSKDPDNQFFDELYSKFDIIRVNARRSINSNASKRGELTELLIRN